MMNKILLRSGRIFIFLSFLFFSCNNTEETKQQTKLERAGVKVDSLSAELKKQREISDSLLEIAQEQEMISKSKEIYFGDEYKDIPNPEAYVVEQLKSRPDKIPLEPVVGGTMQFRKIDVLSNKWVYASYDDGHIQGESVFLFRLQPDGNIRFTEILSTSGG